MIVDTSGRIANDIYMLGPPGVPIFFLDGSFPVIFDAGFSFLGNKYAKDIRNVLGDRKPAHLFLTHAHYDHCGSASVLKSHFPGLKVTASEKSKEILSRPNAIKLMRTLSIEAERFAAKGGKKRPLAKPFEPVDIDQTLKEGDVFELDKGLSIQVLETPGHTRDHLSYYIPEKKILIAGEAAGIPDNSGYIVADCLVGYDMYVSSVEKLAGLDIETLCLGHDFVYTGEDAGNYIKQAVDSCGKFLQLVKTCLEEEQGHMENIMKRIKQIEYDSKQGVKQSESAYMINLEARLKAVQSYLNKNIN